MQPARLLYENGANWHYATGHATSDPTLWCQLPGGEVRVAASSLEAGLLAQHMPTATRLDYAKLREQATARFGKASLAGMAMALLGDPLPETVLVPADFPLGLADALRKLGLNLTTPAAGELFFPGRYVKSMAEVEKLAAAQRLNEQSLHHGVSILRGADVAANGGLIWRGSPLTSEIVRAEMQKKALDLGATEFHGGPIVAGGAQGAFPHERGHGQLMANELIVIDTFPRHANGYWGDLTRTFIKGKASAWQESLYNTVLESQTRALAAIKAGADGKDIDASVSRYFESRGFKNGTDASGLPYGCIHSLGHSIGLELHDVGPGLSGAGTTLVAGSALTVEPGLYYPTDVNGGVGGVRIEDIVIVTDTGHTNLTTFPKTGWILD